MEFGSPAGLAERHPVEDTARARARDADVGAVRRPAGHLPYMPTRPEF
jgi:hypothetical protein